jgi:succinate dehydrogenase / fumarate reductase cytochrome b subunit
MRRNERAFFSAGAIAGKIRMHSSRHATLGRLQFRALRVSGNASRRRTILMPARPKYLNLFQIRLPVPGLVSIMHRMSGAALFLALPLLLWGFEQSLISFPAYTSLRAVFSYWPAKLILIGLAWAYLHHLCAGIRHLAMDMHYGLELASARLTAKLVLGISIALTVAVGVLIW